MKSIEVISIPVSDQARSKEFYLKLGFQIMVDAPFQEGSQWIQMGFEGGGPSITLVTWFKNMPPGCIDGLVIRTDDITKDVEELLQKDVKVGPINDTPWGKFATVTDPDGNQLSLHEE